jgi:hypothetical protein
MVSGRLVSTITVGETIKSMIPETWSAINEFPLRRSWIEKVPIAVSRTMVLSIQLCANSVS